MKEKRKVKKFVVNLWDYIDVEQLNSVLDEKVKGMPVDIGYKIVAVRKNGIATIEATFLVEDI